MAAYEATAQALRLDEPQRLELLPSGSQPVYKNRVGWANDRLKRQGLSESPRRGQWQITRAGIDYVQLDTSMQFDRALTEYLASRRGR